MQIFDISILADDKTDLGDIMSKAAVTIPYAIITQIIGTLIVFYVLAKYVYPIVVRVVKERQQYIESSLEHAEEQRREAEEVKVLVENEKKEIKATRKEVIEEASKQAKIEAHDIINRSRNEASSIMQRAQKEIEAEEKNAQERLSKDTLELVTLVSQKFLSENIDSESEQKLIADALEVVKNAS